MYDSVANRLDYDDHLDSFLQVSELDGQFRKSAQYLFVFKRGYSILSILPNSGYVSQQQAILIKG